MHTEKRKKVAGVVKKASAGALRVAVIGIGNMGKHHARNYYELPEANLVAIADLNEELGQKMADEYDCKYYKDYKEMLKNEDLDAVTVAVPSKYHYPVGLDVIAADVHLLMEKPIAMTEAEGQELIDGAKAKGVKLMVGHIERFNPGVTELKRLLDSGDLGRPISFHAVRVGGMPPTIKDANVLVDIGVHDYDIVSYLLGGVMPDRIAANGGRAHLNGREDNAVTMLNFGDVTAVVESNWVTPDKFRTLSITGTEGYASLDYLTQTLLFYKSIYTKVPDDFGEFLMQYGTPDKQSISVAKAEPLKLELQSFLKAIMIDGQVVTPGEDGLKALQIALAANKDIQNRATV